MNPFSSHVNPSQPGCVLQCTFFSSADVASYPDEIIRARASSAIPPDAPPASTIFFFVCDVPSRCGHPSMPTETRRLLRVLPGFCATEYQVTYMTLYMYTVSTLYFTCKLLSTSSRGGEGNSAGA